MELTLDLEYGNFSLTLRMTEEGSGIAYLNGSMHPSASLPDSRGATFPAIPHRLAYPFMHSTLAELICPVIPDQEGIHALVLCSSALAKLLYGIECARVIVAGVLFEFRPRRNGWLQVHDASCCEEPSLG
jgi:hypothetical protein